MKLILLSLLFISCSSIHISSSNVIPVTFSEQDEHKKLIKYQIERDFFLWGLVPTKQEVDIALELKKQGINSLAELQISQQFNARNAIWSVLTFGFWIPTTINVEGKRKIVN